jgi:transcriptional regulator with XRE-family HTH domain
MKKSVLGKRIRQIRLESGMTQQDLAEKVGITEKQISKIETGVHYPKFENFIKILESFNISMQEFAVQSETEANIIRRKIMRIMNKASEEELQYLLLLVKNVDMINKKYNNNKD